MDIQALTFDIGGTSAGLAQRYRRCLPPNRLGSEMRDD